MLIAPRLKAILLTCGLTALAVSAARPDDKIGGGELVERYYSQFQKPGFLVEDLMAFYTDDIAFTDPTFEIAANGKEELRKLYADLGTDNTSYAGIVWRIETTVTQADRIVIRGNWSGRFQGCAFDVEFVTLWKLRDGLIAEQTDFFAAGTFDRQVGWDKERGAATCAERS